MQSNAKLQAKRAHSFPGRTGELYCPRWSVEGGHQTIGGSPQLTPAKGRQLRMQYLIRAFDQFVPSLFVDLSSPTAKCAPPPFLDPTASVLATGLQGSLGSSVGPDGALYVAEGASARISRINSAGDPTSQRELDHQEYVAESLEANSYECLKRGTPRSTSIGITVTS
jgi:hypothetical protein